MLQKLNAGKYRGFAEGAEGYIVTDNDFVHQVRALSENIELRMAQPWEDVELKFKTFDLASLRTLAEPIPSFRSWAHYWGIKGRVADNYRELLKSMRGIGAEDRKSVV